MLKVLVTCLLPLVLGVGSANAECAWVLWTSTYSLSDGHTEWSTFSAFRTKKECDASASSWIAVERESQKREPKRMWMVTFPCFPDTVDPRGPKGGGR